MASVFQNPPATPRQAARRKSRLDRVLDPALFKALSDPTRLSLLACVVKCGRACSVTEIAECCALDFSMVARHLATMARAGVLTSQKAGRTVWYAASPDLAAWFRVVAEAIEEWAADGACGCAKGGC
jgi:ArsR family transcriptional regulator